MRARVDPCTQNFPEDVHNVHMFTELPPKYPPTESETEPKGVTGTFERSFSRPGRRPV